MEPALSAAEKRRWERKASRLLKTEMTKRSLKCADLVALLGQKGHVVTVQSVHSKLSRGSFSAAFLLRALDAIGCDKLDADLGV